MYSADSQQTTTSLFIVLPTLFLTLVVEFMPWPGLLVPYKPIFPMLALVYWVVHQPQHINYAAAFIIGILMDLANQSPLGFHALSCITTVMMTNIFHNRFMLLVGFAQALHLFVVLAAGQLCLYLLGYLEAQAQPALTWRLFIPSMSSAALWLLLPMMIRYMRTVFAGRGADDAEF